MADTNKDGQVTQAEAEAMALQHFDQMDTQPGRSGYARGAARRPANDVQADVRGKEERQLAAETLGGIESSPKVYIDTRLRISVAELTGK